MLWLLCLSSPVCALALGLLLAVLAVSSNKLDFYFPHNGPTGQAGPRQNHCNMFFLGSAWRFSWKISMALQSLQRSVQIRNYFVNYVNLLNNLRDGHFIFAHNGCELLTHKKWEMIALLEFSGCLRHYCPLAHFFAFFKGRGNRPLATCHFFAFFKRRGRRPISCCILARTHLH